MAVYVLKHPNGFVLGKAAQRHDGWHFYPNVSGRQPSRRGWESPKESLPDWAKKHIEKGATFEPTEPTAADTVSVKP